MLSRSEPIQIDLAQHLFRECQVMAQYVLTSGQTIPVAVVQDIDQFSTIDRGKHTKEDLEKITNAHEQLVQIVAPARPETLMLLASGNNQNWFCRMLGPVPLVRQLTVIATFFMVVFVTLTVFQFDSNLADNAQQLQFFEFLQLFYYLAAAGMGAAFAALFKANQYIVSGVFRPTYAFSYWIRFTLGIMAGLILAVLIPVNGATTFGLTPVLLALLGGFSSSVLYRILTRLIGSLESVVEGHSQTQVATEA